MSEPTDEPTGATAAPQPAADAGEAHYDPFEINDQPTVPADEHQLTRLIKAWRKGRATRNLLEALSDGYVMLFTAVMIGAMIVNLILQTQKNAAACTTSGCVSARALLPWGLFAGLLAAAALLSRMFGPVLASAAEGFWLLDSPLRRRRILGGRLVAVVVAAFVAGAAVGALLSTLIGSSVVAIVAWAAASGLGCAAVVAFAAAEQGAERTALVKALQAVAAFGAVCALVAVVAISAGWLPAVATDQATVLIAAAVAAVAALVLVLSVILAATRLGRIRRARLTSGGALVTGMQGAAFALDFGLMRDILVERNARDRGHVRPTHGRGVGAQALVWRDVQRVFRTPSALLPLAISVVVPYAIGALGLGVVNPFVSGIVLCFVLIPFLGSLRVLSRTPGLARTMPLSTAQLRSAAMVVPAILALLWSAAVVPAFMGVGSATHVGLTIDRAALIALATGVAGLLGAVRWQVTKQVNFNTPAMATAAGALPPGLIFNLLAGFDMVALITAPILFGLSPFISFGIAFIVFLVLRGTFNMEDMQEQQKRQQEEAQRAREARGKPKDKIRISR